MQKIVNGNENTKPLQTFFGKVAAHKCETAVAQAEHEVCYRSVPNATP